MDAEHHDGVPRWCSNLETDHRCAGNAKLEIFRPSNKRLSSPSFEHSQRFAFETRGAPDSRSNQTWPGFLVELANEDDSEQGEKHHPRRNRASKRCTEDSPVQLDDEHVQQRENCDD
jgi:hypothetical protein